MSEALLEQSCERSNLAQAPTGQGPPSCMLAVVRQQAPAASTGAIAGQLFALLARWAWYELWAAETSGPKAFAPAPSPGPDLAPQPEDNEPPVVAACLSAGEPHFWDSEVIPGVNVLSLLGLIVYLAGVVTGPALDFFYLLRRGWRRVVLAADSWLEPPRPPHRPFRNPALDRV